MHRRADFARNSLSSPGHPLFKRVEVYSNNHGIFFSLFASPVFNQYGAAV